MITKLVCLAIPVVCFATQNGGLSRDLVPGEGLPHQWEVDELIGQPPTLPSIVPRRG